MKGPMTDDQLDRAIHDFLAQRHAELVGQARLMGGVAARPTVRTRTNLSRRSSLLALLVLLAAMLGLTIAIGIGGQRSATVIGPGSIAFSRAGDLFVAQPDGSDPQRLMERDPGDYSSSTSSAAMPSDVFQFAFSPDQRRLAYAFYGDGRGGRLVIADVDGRDLGSLDDPTWLEFSWAPDGQRLAVYLASTAELVIVGLDGQRLDTLSLPDGFQLRPIDMSIVAAIPWSPDGRWIAAPGCVLGRPEPCEKTSARYLLVATDGSGSRWLTSDATYEQNDSLPGLGAGRPQSPFPCQQPWRSAPIDGEWQRGAHAHRTRVARLVARRFAPRCQRDGSAPAPPSSRQTARRSSWERTSRRAAPASADRSAGRPMGTTAVLDAGACAMPRPHRSGRWTRTGPIARSSWKASMGTHST